MTKQTTIVVIGSLRVNNVEMDVKHQIIIISFIADNILIYFIFQRQYVWTWK